MANLNVVVRLTRIDRDLEEVRKHVKQHSGVSKGDAMKVDDLLSSIATGAADLAEDARAAYGNRERGGALVKRVRRALGFTVP